MDMKKVKFGNIELRVGHMSCYKTDIQLKDFSGKIVCTPSAFFDEAKPTKDNLSKTKEFGVSLTEDRILYWLNKSESFEYKNNVLVIQTENYTLYVKELGEKNE